MRFLAAFAVTVLLAAPLPARADLTPINVAFVPVADAVPLRYALQQGWFEKAGLDVKITTVGSGSLAAVAVVGGAADIGLANTLSLAVARTKAIPLMIVAPAAQYEANNPTTQLLVTADSPIRTAKDLEGRTVAVAGLHDLLSLGVKAWMAAGGADFAKVHFVEAVQTTMLGALDAKRVDAFVVSEPALTVAETSGRTRMLAGPYGSIAKRLVVDGWFATVTWLAGHRDAALRFSDVMRRATAYTNAHYDEILPLIGSYTSIAPELLRKMRQIKDAQAFGPDQIQPVIDAAAKYGEIPAPFPAAEMIFTARTRL